MKYRLTDEVSGLGFYRIEALIDGPWGPAGTRGGCVEKEDNLSQEGTCWICGNAQVFGDARVSGDAVVKGYAKVSGRAVIRDKAIVSEEAYVSNDAHISGWAVITGRAHVLGRAKVYGHAVIGGHAWVGGVAVVFENAHVSEDAHVYDEAMVSGGARIFGHADLSGGVHVRGGARIGGSARLGFNQDYLMIGPIGSRDDMLSVYRTARGLGASTGCFTGTLEAFETAVATTHARHPYHRSMYERAITYARYEMDARAKSGVQMASQST